MPIEIYPYGVPRDRRVTKPRLKWHLEVTGASGRAIFKRDFYKKSNAEKFARVMYHSARGINKYIHAEITQIQPRRRRAQVSGATSHILSG